MVCHLRGKESKGKFFLGLRSSKITLTKEKKMRKLERARRKKTKLIVEFLVFVLATFEILFGRKKETLTEEIYL